MSEKKQRKHYKPELIEQTVSLVIDGGKSISDVSKELGINQPNISRWVKKERERASFKTAGLDYDSVLAENRELRKQLKIAEQEREILKKATAIFSKNQK